MNKNKILLSISIASMCATMATVFIASAKADNSAVLANGNDTWYHYAAVAPTATRHGSKEFWANSSDNCATHQLTDPGVECSERDFSANDYFYDLTSADDRWVAPTASAPIDNKLDGIVTYGIYPQTKLNDTDGLYSTLFSNAVLQSNGWYKYRGEYYAKVVADTQGFSTRQFNDGSKIVDGKTYWFKCEPIVWKKLPSDDRDGSYYLLSQISLDTGVAFFNQTTSDSNREIGGNTIYGNNYKYSNLRAWLNGLNGTSYSVYNYTGSGFLDRAFVWGDSAIQVTNVINNAYTTDSGSGSCACDDTDDKVFLPSYSDYKTGSYDFVNDTGASSTRACSFADWSMSRSNAGTYWTRSPHYYDEYRLDAWAIKDTGAFQSATVGYEAFVRPAIKIIIE